MRRITLWSLSTITILVLLLSYRTSTSSIARSSVAAGQSGGDVAANGSTAPTDSGATTSRTGSTSPSTGRPPSKKPSATRTAGAAKTYTGTSIDTNYGPVEVQITVVAGKVTKSKVTQVPWNGSRDQEINSYAVPILNREAVQAQNGTIDMVSGATFTSDGYIQSLQAAIDKAHL